jgi:topoisomerase-4 subunit A
MGLRDLLNEWLAFRTTTVTRRLQFRLDKVAAAPAHPRWPAGRVPESRRGDPHHPARGRAQARAHEALQAHRDPGRSDSRTKLRHLAKLEEMKIRDEQKKLAEEREELEGILKSKAKLKKLIATEIESDAEKYGDDRRTKIVEREAAQAIDESELVANEPATIVLSKGGFVRSAKGHEIDPRTLTYKAGDEYQHAARGRSVQQAVFLDSTGRAYSLVAHSLPSARGLGEPLSSRVDPPDGAKWRGVMIGEPETSGWSRATRVRIHGAAQGSLREQEGRQDVAQSARWRAGAAAGAGAWR